MAIAESILKMLEYFLKKHDEKKIRIAEYLDEVAKEAMGLAEVWQLILGKLEQGMQDISSDAEVEEAIKKSLGVVKAQQRVRFFKLATFYEQIYRVIGGVSDPIYSNSIIEYLGNLLTIRNYARFHLDGTIDPIAIPDPLTSTPYTYFDEKYNVFNVIYERDKTQFYLGEDNPKQRIKDFRDAVALLQKEAAAIEVLAKTFRATM